MLGTASSKALTNEGSLTLKLRLNRAIVKYDGNIQHRQVNILCRTEKVYPFVEVTDLLFIIVLDQIIFVQHG